MRYTNFVNTMIVLTVVFFVGLGCTITPWQQSGNSGQPPPAVQTPTPDPETTRLNQKVEDLEKQLQDQAKQKNAPVVNPTIPVIKTRRGVPWANSPRDGFLALRSEPRANGDLDSSDRGFAAPLPAWLAPRRVVAEPTDAPAALGGDLETMLRLAIAEAVERETAVYRDAIRDALALIEAVIAEDDEIEHGDDLAE